MEFPLFLNEGEESARDSAFEATKEARALRVVCPPTNIPVAGEGVGNVVSALWKAKGGAGLAEEVAGTPELSTVEGGWCLESQPQARRAT